MIYIEFIERDRALPVEIFRHLGNQASAWAEGTEDRMILQLGRTLRLGPAPSYLCLWQIPDFGRLDSWEAYFRSPAAAANRRSRAMHEAIHIQRAGLYDALSQAESLEAPLHLIEYVDPLDLSEAAIRDAFAARARQHESLRPLLLLRRLGRAGPEPVLLGFWGAERFADLEAILRENAIAGMRLMDIGLYRPFGEEIF